MKANKLLSLSLAAMLAVVPGLAIAQSGLRYVPAGFCSLSPSASTGLASCSGGLPNPLPTYAVICAVTQGVNWRDDGQAPTAAAAGGTALAAGNCMPYNGNFQAIRFIQTTGGATLTVSFYR